MRSIGIRKFLAGLVSVTCIQCQAFSADAKAEEKAPTASEADTDDAAADKILDFTKGDKLPANAKCDMNLGPTGLRGWAWNSKDMPVRNKARQIMVTSVDTNGPANGKILAGDVIVGASGKPCASDARMALADAITKAEETEQKGKLDLLIWRNGKTSTVTLTLEVMGAYSATAPYNCPKSKKIIEKGYAFLAKKLENAGGGGIDVKVDALALLNSGDPKYYPMIKKIAEGTSEKSTSSLRSWPLAYDNLLACEYTLATKDQSLLPSIQRLTSLLVNGQALNGTWGHGFPEKGGATSTGYGAMNQVSLPITISLILAREAGVKVEGLDEAIGRATRFFRFYVDKGSIPYGDHLPYPRFDDNGKSASGAVMFDVLGDGDAARFFARLATAGHTDRQIGHTGHYFNFFWGPLGSYRSGPEAFQAHFKEIRWYLELARETRGKFVYQPNAGVWDGAHGHKYKGWDCTGAHLLTYAAPNQKIYLTGKKGISATPLTTVEVAETMKAGALTEAEYRNLPTEALLQNLQSWASVTAIRSAQVLAGKEGDFEPQLLALLKSPNRNAKLGACTVFAASGGKKAADFKKARASASVDPLAKLLDDPDPYVRVLASKALAAIGDPSRVVASLALTRMFQKDAGDPSGMVGKYSFNDWFSQGGHPYLLAKSLEGVDPANADLLKNKAVMLEVFSQNHIKEGLDRCVKGVKAGDAWSLHLVMPYIGRYGSSASEALPYLEKMMEASEGKKPSKNPSKDKKAAKGDAKLKAVYDQIKNGKPVELISLADYLKKQSGKEKQSKKGSK